MAIQTLIGNLTQQRLLTNTETSTLRGANGSAPFLRELIRIFEEKAALFLNTCHPSVQAMLRRQGAPHSDADTDEKIMECAYNVFFESDKFSTLPSLRLLLKSIEPALLPSLGLSSTPAIRDIARRVFTGYVARYRIFRCVDEATFRTLCVETETHDPVLFPTYLFDVFQLEKNLSNDVKSRWSAPGANLLAQQARSNVASIAGCVRGIAFYLGEFINSLNLPKPARQFGHLQDRNTQIDFAGGIAVGYVNEMQVETRQLEVLQSNSAGLNSEITRFCLPLLTLIGIPVEVDMSTLNSNLNTINAELQAHRQATAGIDARYDAARDATHQAVDAWRSRVPVREVTFGVKIGFGI